MHISAEEQGERNIYLTTLTPPTHHRNSLIPINHTKKTGWMITEELISKWHASIGLAAQQMGIVRVTLIHAGKPSSAPPAIKKLWAVEWTWVCFSYQCCMLQIRCFFKGKRIREKKWLQVIITQNMFQIKGNWNPARNPTILNESCKLSNRHPNLLFQPHSSLKAQSFLFQ